jgi:hypothetical protein
MNQSRVSGLVALVVVGILFVFPSRLFAGTPASLDDVHHVLQQAAGVNADTPPTIDQQKELLGQAIKMIHSIPHVYHGQLKQVDRDINAALNELSSGDGAHKARTDILDADDLIKSIM